MQSRTGEKIARFGQQTNVCIGVHLIGEYIVAVTVDGIIRTFSIETREMIAQYKIADLVLDRGTAEQAKLRGIGGGSAMIVWMDAHGLDLTVSQDGGYGYILYSLSSGRHSTTHNSLAVGRRGPASARASYSSQICPRFYGTTNPSTPTGFTWASSNTNAYEGAYCLWSAASISSLAPQYILYLVKQHIPYYNQDSVS
jgi:hypothetical protein